MLKVTPRTCFFWTDCSLARAPESLCSVTQLVSLLVTVTAFHSFLPGTRLVEEKAEFHLIELGLVA